ncbi:DUF1566 domain-containing protein [Candidatus Halobeggiatoa sp. HSG11]|nr:DUF1566 domain-containing protein [Candidatus Halobeggiatoa sp. HSG11]
MKLRYTPLSAAIMLALSGTIYSPVFAQTPPQQAIDACNGLSNGSSCSFQTPNSTVNGSCGTVENQLACMPSNGGTGDGTQQPPNGGTGDGTQQPPNDGTGDGTQQPPNDGTGDGTQQPPNGGTGDGTQQPPNDGTGDGTQQPPNGGTGDGTQPPPNDGTGDGTQPPPNDGTGDGTQPPPNDGTGDGTQQPPNGGTGDGTQQPPNDGTGDGTQQPPNDGTNSENQPPQDAIDACNNLNSGNNCSFQTPDSTVSGSCGTVENQLVCMPDGGTGGGTPPDGGTGGETPPDDGTNGGTSDGTPAQPTIDACDGLSQDSSCTFTTPDGDKSGICTVSDTQLSCDPNASSDESSTYTPPDDIGVIIGNTGGTLPDTGQTYCYDANEPVSCPAPDAAFYGQDAQYQGNAMSYTNNGDSTITDNVTGLMWQKSPDTDGDGDINADDKLSYTDAMTYCDNLALAGYSDWQLPDIKQAYSLIDFNGEDSSRYSGTDTSGLIPFIDTDYFDFGYGDTNAGERIIDAQYASVTQYVSTTMNGDQTMFGVNFADGRIKGYGMSLHGQDKTFYVSCVRGNSNYGQNSFTDNSDGTITDSTTDLMWSQDDSESVRDWEQTLAWVEQQNATNYLGYSNWRLPNVKELQSLIDYTRSPDTTSSAAIDPLFNATAITNEDGASDYPYYWSSTTHISYGGAGANAAYLSFGRAIGSIDSGSTWLDVHGAGTQRSDPKTGNATDYPASHGPQGDAQRVYNYARLVRDAGISGTDGDGTTQPDTGTDGDGTTQPYTGTDGDGTTQPDTGTDGDGTTPTQPDNNTYNEVTSELHLPVTDVGAFGLFKVTLKLIGVDNSYNPGYLFEVTEIIPATGTPSATYSIQAGTVSIPSITVGSTVYAAEMTLIPNSEPMRFAISALSE